MSALLDAVREACSPASWSRGVELARIADVSVAEADGEWNVRMTAPGGSVLPQVTLYPASAAWECACPSREDACAHVAAAVIALQRAEEEGRSLAGAGPTVGRLTYRFTRAPGGLALARVVVAGQEEWTLEARLAVAAANRAGNRMVNAVPRDWTVDRLLESARGGLVPSGIMPRLLEALDDCSAVLLDGSPVKVSTRPAGMVARLEDQNDGFRLCLARESDITEVFANGAALCGDTLRPLRATHLTARERDQMRGGWHFAPGQAAELVSVILPDLAKRIPVEIRTGRLPRTRSAPPRLLVETRREGDRLVVVPSLVYGDPPAARIDVDRFVTLGGPVPLRDETAERRLARRLQTELGLTPGRPVEFAGADAVDFAARLEKWSGEVRGAGHRSFFLAPPLQPRVCIGAGAGGRGEWGFDVAFESGEEGSGVVRRADTARVLRAWREGESLVPLIGGGWAPLPADWLARFGDRVAELLAAREANDGRLPACVGADLAELAEGLDQPVPTGLQRLRGIAKGFTRIPAAPLPGDLTATLRPYQRRGVDWLCFLREAGVGALLADDMGLGKTLQALCAVRGRTLIVAPTSVAQNWVEEIARFRPALRVAVYHGPKRRIDPEADATVTSYAILRQDADLLAAERWQTVVLDEAQNIKNPDSQVARAAYRLQAEFRVVLTGTPVENRLEELWSQFHFLNRGLLGGRADFAERYARPMAAGDPGATERLRERIRPFVLRRLKQEVAPELPPRTDVVLHCELSGSERAVYDAVRAATVPDVVERLRSGGSVLEALEALLRLRQAACHPALVPGQSGEASSKLEVLMEALDSVVAEGHKALVFSQWTSLLDLLEPHLRGAGFAFVRLDGSTRDRGAVVASFQSDDGPPVMLVSLKAGGTGLNLTAADHVFLLDPWWNPAAEEQAADRAHRIGQERPVVVYRLVATDTVEERILALQEHKRRLSGAALGGAEQAASLTRDDLLALLE